MKRLLNVLYITNPHTYLTLSGGNVDIKVENESLGKIPLHNIEGICSFGYQGMSPALMNECLVQQIGVSFFSPSGRFRARVTGPVNGNVHLRKTQYRWSDNEQQSLNIAKNMILAKGYNASAQLKRANRDYALRLDGSEVESAIQSIDQLVKEIDRIESLEQLRGVEGYISRVYFSQLDQLILRQKEYFYFHGRNRRPPLDRMNAMLSFAYSLLAHEVASALEGVGLDAYVGFMHTDRPGRISLALDVMEELRPVYADRFVLSLVNTKQITDSDFIIKENKAVLFTEEGRKKFISAWQGQKEQQLTHPFLKEKIKWGLVPHIQAQLLARTLRGDFSEYPPFLWRS